MAGTDKRHCQLLGFEAVAVARDVPARATSSAWATPGPIAAKKTESEASDDVAAAVEEEVVAVEAAAEEENALAE